MKGYMKGKIPAPPPPPPPPEPDDTAAKQAAAEAKMRQRRRAAAGSMNKTLATSPEGVLGSAPINRPTLNSTLG
jgi:hypothetical protein